jgi:hypothetical protein
VRAEAMGKAFFLIAATSAPYCCAVLLRPYWDRPYCNRLVVVNAPEGGTTHTMAPRGLRCAVLLAALCLARRATGSPAETYHPTHRSLLQFVSSDAAGTGSMSTSPTLSAASDGGGGGGGGGVVYASAPSYTLHAAVTFAGFDASVGNLQLCVSFTHALAGNDIAACC